MGSFIKSKKKKKNRAKKRAVGVEVGCEEGWVKFEKAKVGNIGGLHKIDGLGTLCQLWHLLNWT